MFKVTVWFSPVLLSSSWPSFQLPSLAKIQPSLLVYSISESLVSRLQVRSPKSIDYIWTPPPTTVNDQKANEDRQWLWHGLRLQTSPRYVSFFCFCLLTWMFILLRIRPPLTTAYDDDHAMTDTKKGPRVVVDISWAFGKIFFPFLSLSFYSLILFYFDSDDGYPPSKILQRAW